MKTLEDLTRLLADPSSFAGPATVKVGNGLSGTAEAMAEAIFDAGFKVYVHRAGTGNGSHSGRFKNAVDAVEIVGRWIAA